MKIPVQNMDRPVCGAQTQVGRPCKLLKLPGQEHCWMHVGPTCSVCLGSMGPLRQTRKLACNHEFHVRCLERWKASCPTEPTCPMCREPFDQPLYKCRLIIERVGDHTRATEDFETQNIQEIIQGFGIDFRSLLPSGTGRLFTDIHFDIEPNEVLEEILRELRLPQGPFRFD